MNIISIINKLIDFIKYNLFTTQAPCGTIITKLPFMIDIPEGKEVTKFNPITGKLYWPSDGSYAEHPSIRDIPN